MRPASPAPPTSSASAAPTTDTSGLAGHPRGLGTLFFTEMWERFSYYGMRALLVLFMVASVDQGGLGFGHLRATSIYGNYTMSVYILTIVGGFIADNFIGARRSVLIGGIIIACGHFSLAFASLPTFYLGLVLIVLGTGLLKPNISTMVGSLYTAEDDRRDAGFSIFYMGINLGALIAPLVCGFLAQSTVFNRWLLDRGFDPRHSWHWGFAAAGVGMTIGLVLYVAQRPRLARVGLPPASGRARPWKRLGAVLLGSAVLTALMMLSDRHPWIIYFIFGLQVAVVIFFALRRGVENKRLAAIMIFFIAAEIFWSIFEQAGSSISLFAQDLTNRAVANHGALDLGLFRLHIGDPFPASWFQSLNSLWVILLAPAFAWLWVRWGVRQPSSPIKFVLGLLFVALSFVLMVPAAQLAAKGLVSPLWLVGLFFLQTVGELCLSPVGLSVMTKLAPARLSGLVMGIWFLAAALGNKLAGVLAGSFTPRHPAELVHFFLIQAVWVGVVTLALFALSPWVKKLMGGVH